MIFLARCRRVQDAMGRAIRRTSSAYFRQPIGHGREERGEAAVPDAKPRRRMRGSQFGPSSVVCSLPKFQIFLPTAHQSFAPLDWQRDSAHRSKCSSVCLALFSARPAFGSAGFRGLDICSSSCKHLLHQPHHLFSHLHLCTLQLKARLARTPYSSFLSIFAAQAQPHLTPTAGTRHPFSCTPGASNPVGLHPRLAFLPCRQTTPTIVVVIIDPAYTVHPRLHPHLALRSALC